MTEVLRYEVGSGTVLVEADENGCGVDRRARNGQGILDVGRRDAHFILRTSWTPVSAALLHDEETC
ncbi:MAG TPA: hypothetical protein VIQ52_08240 [Arthrobacter sp.]